MRRQVEFRPEAREDIQEAYDFYEGKSQGLGDQFLLRLIEAELYLRDDAEAFQPAYRGTRRYVMDQFPYVLTYRIVEDLVVIVAVTHGARHPREWRRRV